MTEMVTGTQIQKGTSLHEKGAAWLDAAFEYWEEYQKTLGNDAVVYLQSRGGHLVVFTRGENTCDIMRNITNLSNTDDLDGENQICSCCGHTFGV